MEISDTQGQGAPRMEGLTCSKDKVGDEKQTDRGYHEGQKQRDI